MCVDREREREVSVQACMKINVFTVSKHDDMFIFAYIMFIFACMFQFA